MTEDASGRTRSWWGWGWAEEALSDRDCTAYGALLPGLPDAPLPVPTLSDLTLSTPRVGPPASLSQVLTVDPLERAGHTYGKAYRDVVRALYGDLSAAPDLVARPASEGDVVAVLEWASDAGIAVVPYGAGSSVVGGVEYRGDAHRAVVSLDLSALDRVLEVDRVTRSARIQAGARGPVLEDQIRPVGLTLRHFPQSFQFSTLGGWLATRSGGHYATGPTHIDDFVESVRAVTPVGISESWRLPGSGAGPSPDRLLLGSEGILGVITEAWMRLQDRPVHRASTSVRFDDVHAAVAAVREVAQSGLQPANCRLLDPGEAALSGVADDGATVVVVGFESAHHPVSDDLARVVEITAGHGGSAAAPASLDGPDGGDDGRDVGADRWRSSFLRMPYLRDGMARMGAIVETFETACTWDRVDDLYEDVRDRLGRAVVEVTGGPGLVNCRFTHLYPDGAAPYFTVVAVGRRGSEVAMWDELKAASMDLLGGHRATVTHHHAVGRDHRPGYDRQRPEPFAAALRAAKAALDPAGILNPGVLVDPLPPAGV